MGPFKIFFLKTGPFKTGVRVAIAYFLIGMLLIFCKLFLVHILYFFVVTTDHNKRKTETLTAWLLEKLDARARVNKHMVTLFLFFHIGYHKKRYENHCALLLTFLYTTRHVFQIALPQCSLVFSPVKPTYFTF